MEKWSLIVNTSFTPTNKPLWVNATIAAGVFKVTYPAFFGVLSPCGSGQSKRCPKTWAKFLNATRSKQSFWNQISV